MCVPRTLSDAAGSLDVQPVRQCFRHRVHAWRADKAWLVREKGARCIGYANDAVWITLDSAGSDKAIHQGTKGRISSCEVLRSMVEAQI